MAETADRKENQKSNNALSPSDKAQQARSAHVASNISSSLSGGRVGNMVGNKKMNLLDAMHDATPQVGRRPTPVNDPWPRRRMFIRGILLALLVCIVVAVIAVVLSQLGDIGGDILTTE